MKTGAVIVAAGMSSRMNSFKPMLELGNTTIVKRVITTIKQSGADPIVVVTGNQADILEKHISHMGVVCVRNEKYAETQMFDSAKIGFMYLQNQCDRFFFTPVDIPLFTLRTLQDLMECESLLSCPIYNKVQGHPILISSKLIPVILDYKGSDGLKGAVAHCQMPIRYIQVKDEGITYDADTREDYHLLLEKHNKQLLHAQIQIKLARETAFFGPGAAQLLKLVESTGSLRNACMLMHMSYSKGWKTINLIEQQLGYQVLIRQAGGLNGGNSELTEYGEIFLNNFMEFEEESRLAVLKLFHKYFT